MSADAERPTLVVVRHGATEWSRNGRHTGRTDLPLLPEGEEQARTAGALLHGRPFGLVLCSPLGRARATCELAGYADQAELTDDLLEWDYGEYEGVTTTEIRETVPGWTVWTLPSPGGETADEVGALWDKLADGAEIIEKFGPSPFSPGFGMLTDRFGVTWVVDTAGEP